MSGAFFPPGEEEALRNSPLFAGLEEEEFNTAAGFLKPRKIKKGNVMFREGDAGGEMFIFLSGKLSAYINLSDGNRWRMFDIERGESFGEMSIIANEPRSAAIIAGEDSEVMGLRAGDFYRLIFDHPAIGVKILRAIGRQQSRWLDQSARHLSDLTRWGETARRRAITDELTGIYNRRFLEESVKDRFEQGSVGPRTLALLMMDLDRIHEINERYGVQAGDRVFIAVAEILKTHTRPEDICARLSGDEFAVLLPDTGPENALIAAERIREAIAGAKVKVPSAPGSAETLDITVHASIGIAAAPDHSRDREGLFRAADQALRKAKDSGRNRVIIYG